MIGFFRFVLIFIGVLFLLGFISRILLKYFLRRLARRMEHQQNNYDQKVGDTYIKNPAEKEKLVSKDTGEYVDFEEIKE